MSGVLLLVSTLLPFVIQALQNYKVISPSLGSLITGIEGAAATATTEFAASGATGTPSATLTTTITAINDAIAVLRTQTTISPTDLLIIGAFGSAVAAANTAVASVTSVDPTKLQPITPV